ncbi:hypothetical protein PF010_g30873 [Phytophthora fragariae]|nr:hypothetical protein PF010_g30873 [Phytophthora fragariae]
MRCRIFALFCFVWLFELKLFGRYFVEVATKYLPKSPCRLRQKVRYKYRCSCLRSGCVAADAVVGCVVVAADEGCVVAAATVGEGWSTLISPDV